MAPAAQSYATHVRRPAAWNVAFLLALVALVLLLTAAVREPSLQGVALALLATSVLVAVSVLRMMGVRLQDRIIRLEMGVRLVRLGLGDALGRLSVRQLVALRFASDPELPALVARAVEEQLAPDVIKRAVREWQPDTLRV